MRVVVVGGGIIGCSTALSLAKRGAEVILFERDQIASAASGRNHGLLFYPQSHECAALYKESRKTYAELSSESPVDTALDEEPCGLMILVEDPDGWAAAKAEADTAAAGGISIDRLDDSALRRAEPALAPLFAGAWRLDDGYRCDPAALTLAIALEARNHGAVMRTNTHVKQVFIRSGNAAGVVADDGVTEADVVVNAAGPWAPALVRSIGDLEVRGVRGWLSLTKPLPTLVRHIIETAGWHLTAGTPGPAEVSLDDLASGRRTPEIGLLVQQNRSGHVMLGGSRMASLTDEPEGPEVVSEMARRAQRTVPQLVNVPMAAVWSGVRPMSRDGLPLIGWAPGIEGLFVASGHGGQGVMLGAGTGELAAQMILDQQPLMDPGPFDPGRGMSSHM